MCIPETFTDIHKIVEGLRVFHERRKRSVMVIVAEGDEIGNAATISERLKEADCPYASRCVVLGHLQRGGTPTPEDRLLATQVGAWAVEAIDEGANGVMSGRLNGERLLTPLPETFAQHRSIPASLLNLVDVLSH